MFGKAKPPYGTYSLFFLVGTVIGATAGLFLAPTTGRKLQKQFKEVVEDGMENVQSVMKRVVNA